MYPSLPLSSLHSHVPPLSSRPAPFYLCFISNDHLLPLHHLALFSSLLPASRSLVSFLVLVRLFTLRADINECERLPQPCAHRCLNTPGSYKCTCPPGRYLLGDGKSCAGLERLPSFESYSYGYRASQSSPDSSSYQRLYHNLASQSFHSYTASTRGRQRGRSRRQAASQGALVCPQGLEMKGGFCFGNYGAKTV